MRGGALRGGSWPARELRAAAAAGPARGSAARIAADLARRTLASEGPVVTPPARAVAGVYQPATRSVFPPRLGLLARERSAVLVAGRSPLFAEPGRTVARNPMASCARAGRGGSAHAAVGPGLAGEEGLR